MLECLGNEKLEPRTAARGQTGICTEPDKSDKHQNVQKFNQMSDFKSPSGNHVYFFQSRLYLVLVSKPLPEANQQQSTSYVL